MASSISPRRRAAVVTLVAAFVAALIVLAGLLISRSGSASGDVSTVSGGAFGVDVHVRTPLGAAVDSGPAPAVELPPGGGGPISDRLASVDVPSLASTGVLEVSTEGTTGPQGSVTSSASVATVRLAGGQVTGDLVKCECRADSSGTRAGTTLENLRVGGQPVSEINPPPNTKLTVPGVGTLVLNEQTGSTGDGSLVVNALHLRTDSPVLGTGDMVVGQARCQVRGPDVVIPVGAVGGTGLALMLGALLWWKLGRRRPNPEAGPSPALGTSL